MNHPSNISTDSNNFVPTSANSQFHPCEDAPNFEVSISDENFVFSSHKIADRKCTGSQLAELAGKHPVTDFVILQHLKNRELETLRPNEIVDLGESGVERFFIIASGEIFRFTIEGLSMEWPRPSILCSKVKFLAGIPVDECLVIDGGGCKRLLKDDDVIILRSPGVEELRIRKCPRTITVKYGEHQFELESREYTTEELMKEFGVPAGYKLDHITPEGVFHELKPGEKIKIKECMEFASHPPCGQSS